MSAARIAYPPHVMAAVIDFHSHFFSRPFFETLAALSPQPGTVDEKLARVSAKAGLALPPADVGAHLARWVAEWDRNGVTHAVSFARRPADAPALAEAARLAAGRMTPFALVNPRADGAAQRAEALLGQHGFKGLLFFPAMHQFDPSGPEAAAVFEVVDRHRACAVVHCGMLQVKLRDLLGLPRPYDFRHANPLRVAPAANRFRSANFVIPHFGAGMLRETLMVGAQCENVFVDTSSSNDWIRTQEQPTTLARVFERALGVFGANRILFGTDSSTFPRGFRADLLKTQREALDVAGVTRDQQDAIFQGNAARLLGR